ncbi:MAG: hypothetical protein J5992_00360 [Oscillospiraceae bacterium]|nr:hypothetical protein [Oscillospiraceae bacterium]
MDKFIFSKESGGIESNPPETFIKDIYDNGEDEWYHQMYLEYEKEQELLSSKNSVASFVIGIISIVIPYCFQIYLPIYSIICGIKAIRHNAEKRKLAIWGIILSSISLLLSFAVFLPLTIYFITKYN